MFNFFRSLLEEMGLRRMSEWFFARKQFLGTLGHPPRHFCLPNLQQKFSQLGSGKYFQINPKSSNTMIEERTGFQNKPLDQGFVSQPGRRLGRGTPVFKKFQYLWPKWPYLWLRLHTKGRLNQTLHYNNLFLKTT
jgi:hypothetical protein